MISIWYTYAINRKTCQKLGTFDYAIEYGERETNAGSIFTPNVSLSIGRRITIHFSDQIDMKYHQMY